MPRCNGLVVVVGAAVVVVVVIGVVGVVVVVVGTAVVGARPFEVLKLCLHVGHVLWLRSHSIKLSGLNMCPQCRMRATRCVGSNVSCVIEHTVFNGRSMV